MIQITRLNKHPFVVNADLIKFIEESPDTVITLLSGEKIVVQEPAETVIERIVAYRRRILGGLGSDVPPVPAVHNTAESPLETELRSRADG